SREVELTSVFPDLVLGQVSDRKAGGGQLRLGQRPEEIRLVLTEITSAAENPALTSSMAVDSSVVAGRHRSGVPRVRTGEERAELQIGIAGDTRHRSTTTAVVLGERTNDGAIELVGDVQKVVGDT